jgi:hypothetical protein
LWPHIAQFYRKVSMGRVETIYRELGTYDVVLMIDVIEHIEKSIAFLVLRHFVDSRSIVVVSSPIQFFRQENFGSMQPKSGKPPRSARLATTWGGVESSGASSPGLDGFSPSHAECGPHLPPFRDFPSDLLPLAQAL